MLPQPWVLLLDLLLSELNMSQQLLDPFLQCLFLLIQGLDEISLGEGRNGFILGSRGLEMVSSITDG